MELIPTKITLGNNGLESINTSKRNTFNRTLILVVQFNKLDMIQQTKPNKNDMTVWHFEAQIICQKNPTLEKDLNGSPFIKSYKNENVQFRSSKKLTNLIKDHSTNFAPTIID